MKFFKAMDDSSFNPNTIKSLNDYKRDLKDINFNRKSRMTYLSFAAGENPVIASHITDSIFNHHLEGNSLVRTKPTTSSMSSLESDSLKRCAAESAPCVSISRLPPFIRALLQKKDKQNSLNGDQGAPNSDFWPNTGLNTPAVERIRLLLAKLKPTSPNLEQRPGPSLGKPSQAQLASSESSEPSLSHHHVDGLKDDKDEDVINSRRLLSKMREFMYSRNSQGVGLQLLLAGCLPFVVTTPKLLRASLHIHHEKMKLESYVSFSLHRHDGDMKEDNTPTSSKRLFSRMKDFMHYKHFQEVELQSLLTGSASSPSIVLSAAPHPHEAHVRSSSGEIPDEMIQMGQPGSVHPSPPASVPTEAVEIDEESRGMIEAENSPQPASELISETVTEPAGPSEPTIASKLAMTSESIIATEPTITFEPTIVSEFMMEFQTVTVSEPVAVTEPETIPTNTVNVTVGTPASDMLPNQINDTDNEPKLVSNQNSPSPPSSSSTSTSSCVTLLQNTFDLKTSPPESTPSPNGNASESCSSFSIPTSPSPVNEFGADLSSLKTLINACKDWKTKGNECMKSKFYAEAIPFFTNALLLLQTSLNSHPTLHALMLICHTNRATAEMKIQKYSSALLDCSCALQLQPDNVQIKIKVASCLLTIGELKQAYDLAENCKEVAKSNSESNRNLLLIQKNVLGAMEEINAAHAISLQNNLEKWEEGLSMINHALHLYCPFSEIAAQIKALLMIKMKKYEEVISFCQNSFEPAKASHLSENNDMEAIIGEKTKNSYFSFSSPSASFSFPLPLTYLPLLHWRTIVIFEALYEMADVNAIVEYLNTSEFHELMNYSMSNDEVPSMVEKELITLPDFLSSFQYFYGFDSKAMEAVNNGHFDSAIAIASEALAHERISKSRKFASVFFVHRASGHAANGAYLHALIDASHAVTLDKTSISAHSLRVHLYECIDDSAGAKSSLEALIELYNRKLYEEYDQETSEELQNCEYRLRKVLYDIANGVHPNPYFILNSNIGDSAGEIRRRYFKLCLSIHPDKVKFLPDPDGLLWREVGEEVIQTHNQIFQLLNNANECIQNQNEDKPRRRKKRSSSTYSNRNANQNQNQNQNENTNTNADADMNKGSNVNSDSNENSFQKG